MVLKHGFAVVTVVYVIGILQRLSVMIVRVVQNHLIEVVSECRNQLQELAGAT